MELKEMIKVMQHYADGGDIEYLKKESTKEWRKCYGPCWDWDTFDYRIKEVKQKITIEKWLCKSGENSFYIYEGTDADELEKVKLLGTYEIELKENK